MARDTETPLVDVYAAFSQRSEDPGLDKLLLDGMHPNDWGQRLVADLLAPAIAELASGAAP